MAQRQFFKAKPLVSNTRRLSAPSALRSHAALQTDGRPLRHKTFGVNAAKTHFEPEPDERANCSSDPLGAAGAVVDWPMNTDGTALARIEMAGKALAIAYTLVETAKLDDVDTQAWTTWGFGQVDDHYLTKLDELFT
jgi:hypothetical protein